MKNKLTDFKNQIIKNKVKISIVTFAVTIFITIAFIFDKKFKPLSCEEVNK